LADVRHRCLGLIFGIAACSSIASQAQANEYMAERKITFQVGVGASLASADYSKGYDRGISGFATVDLPHHLGLDFEYHNPDLDTPYDVGEVSYLGGIRYRLSFGRWRPYVKALGGIGQLKLDQGYYVAQTTTNYLVAFGGGL